LRANRICKSAREAHGKSPFHDWRGAPLYEVLRGRGKVKSKLNTNECEDDAWDGTREKVDIEMNIEENKMGNNRTEGDTEE